MKLKKGDKVIVVAGKNKGSEGVILRAFPNENKVLIEGMNVVKKHRRGTAQSRKGQIVDRPMPIHASNVMIKDPKSGKPTRIKMKVEKDGTRVRVAVKSGQEIA